MKLSIITITFNDCEGLARTCASILEQSYPYIEHIVVDGGSTDGSLEFLKARALEDADFRFISEMDNGIADAMEKGLRFATGSLCMHLNAGDVLYTSEVIEQVVESYATEQWEWGVGNLIYDEADGLYRKKINCFDSNELRKGCYLPQPATFFSRSIYTQVKFDESLKIAMDYDLFYRLAFVENLRPHPLDIDVTLFDRSGVSQNFWRAFRENVRVRLKYKQTLKSLFFEACHACLSFLRRLIRQLVLSLFGEAAKNKLRQVAGTASWRIEKV